MNPRKRAYSEELIPEYSLDELSSDSPGALQLPFLPSHGIDPRVTLYTNSSNEFTDSGLGSSSAPTSVESIKELPLPAISAADNKALHHWHGKNHGRGLATFDNLMSQAALLDISQDAADIWWKNKKFELRIRELVRVKHEVCEQGQVDVGGPYLNCCGHSFTTAKARKDHESKSFPQRVFICPLWDRSDEHKCAKHGPVFLLPQHVRQHLTGCHSVDPPKELDAFRLWWYREVCQICNTRFTSFKEGVRHAEEHKAGKAFKKMRPDGDYRGDLVVNRAELLDCPIPGYFPPDLSLDKVLFGNIGSHFSEPETRKKSKHGVRYVGVILLLGFYQPVFSDCLRLAILPHSLELVENDFLIQLLSTAPYATASSQGLLLWLLLLLFVARSRWRQRPNGRIVEADPPPESMAVARSHMRLTSFLRWLAGKLKR